MLQARLGHIILSATSFSSSWDERLVALSYAGTLSALNVPAPAATCDAEGFSLLRSICRQQQQDQQQQQQQHQQRQQQQQQHCLHECCGTNCCACLCATAAAVSSNVFQLTVAGLEARTH